MDYGKESVAENYCDDNWQRLTKLVGKKQPKSQLLDDADKKQVAEPQRMPAICLRILVSLIHTEKKEQSRSGDSISQRTVEQWRQSGVEAVPRVR